MLETKDKWDSHHDSHAPEVVRHLQPKRPPPAKQDQIVKPSSDRTPPPDYLAFQHPRDLQILRDNADQADDARGGVLLEKRRETNIKKSLVDDAKGDPDSVKKVLKLLMEQKVMMDRILEHRDKLDRAIEINVALNKVITSVK